MNKTLLGSLKAAAAGFAVLGAQAAAGGAVALTNALLPLLGTAGLLPGVLFAGAAAAGTLKLALFGLGDALKESDPKKLKVELSKLSPAAREFVKAINSLKPAFRTLALSVQQSLFDGLGGSVKTLAGAYLPLLQKHLTALASTFRVTTQDVIKFLVTGQSLRDFETIMLNVRHAFANLRPAVVSVVQIMRDLTVVASGFLPGLATGVTGVTEKLRDMVAAGRASGGIADWIQDGITATKVLGQTLGNVVGILHSVFAASGGAGLLTTFAQVTGAADTFLKTAAGEAALKSFFDSAAQAGQVLLPVLTQAVLAVGQLSPLLISVATGAGPGVVALLAAITSKASLLGPAARILGESLGTVLVTVAQMAPQLLGLLGAIVSAAGPFMVSFAQIASVLTSAVIPAALALLPVLTQVGSAVSETLTAGLSQLGPVLSRVNFRPLVGALLGILPVASRVGSALAQQGPALVNKLIPAIVKTAAAAGPLIVSVTKLALALASSLMPHVTVLASFLSGTVIPALRSVTDFMTRHSDGVLVAAASVGIIVAGFKAFQAATVALGAAQTVLGAIQTAAAAQATAQAAATSAAGAAATASAAAQVAAARLVQAQVAVSNAQAALQAARQRAVAVAVSASSTAQQRSAATLGVQTAQANLNTASARANQLALASQTAAQDAAAASSRAGALAQAAQRRTLLQSTAAVVTNAATWVANMAVAAASAVASAAATAASWVATAATTVASWVATAASAVANAATTAAAWVASGARIAGQFIATAAAAAASAARTAAVWVASGARTIAIQVAQGAAFVASRAVMLAGAAATGVMTAAQWLLNAAMTANPIGLIIVAIGALIAIGVYLLKHNEKFRALTLAVWGAIKTAVGAVVNWLKAAVPTALEFVKNAFFRFNPLGIVLSHWSQIVGFVRSSVDKVIGFVAGLGARVKGALSNAGRWLYDSGKAILQGLIDGIVNTASHVKDAVVGVLSDIRNLFPFSPAKEGPFSGSGYTTHSGLALMRDLGKGAEAGVPALKGALSTALAKVQPSLAMSANVGSLDYTSPVRSLTASGSSSSTVNNYTIAIPATVKAADAVPVADQVRAVLAEINRGGRVTVRQQRGH